MEDTTKKAAPNEAVPVNLWEKVGNRCLTNALELLKWDYADGAIVEMVKELVDVAISIDILNLQREQCQAKPASIALGYKPEISNAVMDEIMGKLAERLAASFAGVSWESATSACATSPAVQQPKAGT